MSNLSAWIEFNPPVSLEKGKDYPFVGMDQIQPGIRYVRANTHRNFPSGGARFRHGDTLFARITPCLENGKIAQFISEDEAYGFGSTEFFVLRAKENISDSSFVYYLAQTELLRETAIQSMVGASGRQRADVESLRQLEIALPDLPTQQKIGQALAHYDNLIEINRRRIALLEESARLLYREWFVCLRFPGHATLHTKNGMPEGWKPGFASEFVSVLSGGTPNTKTDRFWNGDIPFFTPKDCSGSMYVLTTEKTITEDGLTACNSRLFDKETIFITARGTVGKLAMAQRPMAMNQSCYALEQKDGLNNLFLFLALEDGVAHLKTMASGGVFDAIVVDTFKRMPFICPTLDLANKFGEAVRPMFDQIECLLRQNEALAAARDELVPRLMSGEIQA
jgi:type I restriction enzyme S subunit